MTVCCVSRRLLTFNLVSFPLPPTLLFLRSAEPSGSFDLGEAGDFDDGLRRRNVPPFDAPRPRTSDEEDEEEELEFKLAEKKDEKAWLSVNKCIAGALVLLFLGSLFLSGESPGLHLPAVVLKVLLNHCLVLTLCRAQSVITHFPRLYKSFQSLVLLKHLYSLCFSTKRSLLVTVLESNRVK